MCVQVNACSKNVLPMQFAQLYHIKQNSNMPHCILSYWDKIIWAQIWLCMWLFLCLSFHNFSLIHNHFIAKEYHFETTHTAHTSTSFSVHKMYVYKCCNTSTASVPSLFLLWVNSAQVTEQLVCEVIKVWRQTCMNSSWSYSNPPKKERKRI